MPGGSGVAPSAAGSPPVVAKRRARQRCWFGGSLFVGPVLVGPAHYRDAGIRSTDLVDRSDIDELPLRDHSGIDRV
jgi:hypothetical protein